MPVAGWPALRLKTCRTFTVATGDPLASHKSANKLLNVLARAEAEAEGFDEALLVNTDGQVTESSSGNVFWWECGTLHTPPLAAGAGAPAAGAPPAASAARRVLARLVALAFLR